jgi:hypothetical protein
MLISTNNLNNKFNAWIEGNIFFITYFCHTLTLDTAREALKVRLELSKNVGYAMLSDIRHIKNVDSEARKFLGVSENNVYLNAGAILVNSQFHKIAGNLFILTNKLPVPAKLFTDRDQAIEWLNQFNHKVYKNSENFA